jgi:hypothetical protein
LLNFSKTQSILQVRKRTCNQAIITQKGRSHYLIGRKKKRTKVDVLEEEKELMEEKWNIQKKNLVEEIEDMKKEMDVLNDTNMQLLDNKEKLAQLFEKGLIDKDGQPIYQE